MIINFAKQVTEIQATTFIIKKSLERMKYGYTTFMLNYIKFRL